MTNNAVNYEKPAVVSYYRDKQKLSPPEQTILKIIRELRPESMIDIGVGAGRTTASFAPLVKCYVGVDYSRAMVETVKQKFAANPDCDFLFCDARDMSYFEDSSFDFVLFSFNGIDCVSFADRQKILSEIKRIGKKDSYFAFSTHNLYSVPVLFSFQFPRNPLKYLREFRRVKGVRKLNPSKETILKNDYFSMIDGDIDFAAEYLYYKPERQILELTEHGFSDIRMFSLKNGSEIGEVLNMENLKDPWLYFLCKNEKY